MDVLDLAAVKREKTGKEIAKKIRKEGLIPAVVYKGGKIGTNVSVEKSSLLKVLHTKAGENVLINLIFDEKGDKKKKSQKNVLMKEIQYNPVTDEIVHVDFVEISLTEKIEVEVPLSLKGDAIGVKQDKGTLEQILWKVKIRCLPTNIPEKIEADISALKISDILLLKDVKVPEDIEVLTGIDSFVATVSPPRAEEVKEEVPAGEEATEPELIREKKVKEEEEGEEAGEETKKETKQEGKS